MSETRGTTLLWAQALSVAIVLVILVSVAEFVGFADLSAQLFLLSLGVFFTAPLVIGSVVGSIGGWSGFVVALFLVAGQAVLDIAQFSIRVALLRSDLLHIGFLVLNILLMALSLLSLVLMLIEYWARRSAGESNAALDLDALTNAVRVVGAASLLGSFFALLVVLPLSFAALGQFTVSVALLLMCSGHVPLGLYAMLVDYGGSAVLGNLLILLVLVVAALDIAHISLRLLGETTMPSLTSITLDNIADMLLLFISITFLVLSAVYLAVTAWLWRDRGLVASSVSAVRSGVKALSASSSGSLISSLAATTITTETHRDSSAAKLTPTSLGARPTHRHSGAARRQTQSSGSLAPD